MEDKLFAGITRRDFAYGMAAAAASLGMLSLAGCGTSQRASEAGSSASSSSSDADSDTAATSSDGFTLTYCLNEDPQALDPALVNDFGSLELCANLYEGLFRFVGETCEVEPCLAESYEVSDDGLTYTFHLRQGVKFHDGTDFDAAAVVTNFERQMDGNALENMSYADFVFGSDETGVGVKSVEATDDQTVTVTMRAACTPFLRNLAMALGTPIVSPTALEKAGGDMSREPCGTGPFKLDSWKSGETVTLVRNEDYWDEDNKAKADRVVFKVMPEASTRVTALSNNETDIITAVEMNSAPAVENNGDTVVAIDGLNVNDLIFNLESEALADVEVRRAVCQAINVPEMITALYGDYAEVANSFMPSFMASYVDQVSYPEYDPDAARETLEKAGVKELTLMTYSTAMQYNPAGGTALAESVQGYLSEVGVTATVLSYDWTTFRTKRKEEYFDIIFSGWAGDNGDPDNFMNLFASASSTAEMAHYSSKDYDALISEGLETPDGDDRDAIYLKCEQTLAEDLPVLPLSHAKTVCAYKPNVKDFSMHSTGWSKLAGVSKE